MAIIKPDNTFVLNGVIVNEKIIPDGTRWVNPVKAAKAGFPPSALYKKQQKLCNGTGKPKYLTIHNTNDLPRVEDDGEQYTRATFNENMKTVRIHFYVDDLGAWQNLRAGTGMSKNDPEGSAEVSWHAADGSTDDGGNMTSLSMEIIMNDTPEHDRRAYENGAKLAAWLLYKHGLSIDSVVTHTYWLNKSSGKTFDDVDEQCTNMIKGKKWCPQYIFNSTKHDVALKNWKQFKACVQKYLDGLPEDGTCVQCNSMNEMLRTLYLVRIGSFVKKTDSDSLIRSLKADGFNAFTVKTEDGFSVQVGAYSIIENANALKRKLKEAGYDSEMATCSERVSM